MSKNDEKETAFSAAVERREVRGEKKTVEQWAASKGMLPEMIPPPPAQKGVIPEAPRWNPKYGEFAAARAGSRWPEGAEMTEADFDAAVAKFYGPTNVLR